MTKETRLTFRIRSELKKSLEAIAEKEARSVAQVCEVILQNGVFAYQREGTKYLHRLIASQKSKAE
jgi:predicted transcriptional regulator